MIVIVVASTVSPVVVPLTVSVSAPSYMSSSVGTNVNGAVALVSLALMVSVKSETVAKSVPAVAVAPPTETVTEVALVRALPSRVPVTVMGVPPAPSETVAGSTDRITLVGAASLSVIVIVVASTVSPVVVPLTVSVSAPSYMSSSVGVRLKVVLPRVALALMVSVKSETVAKSVPAVAVAPPTETVTEVALVRALPSRVPVTVMGVPLAPSETVAGSTDRITLVGAPSLSVIVIVVASTVSPVVVPLTVSVSAPSYMSSSVGTNVNGAVALVSLALMVSVKSETVAKSVPAVAVAPPTETVTEVALVRALPSRVPVTVMGVPPAPSETVAGSTDRITLVGAASLSVIVIVVASTVSPVVVPLTVSVSAPSYMSSSVGVRLKVVLPRVALALMVSVKSETVAKSVPAVAVAPPTETVTEVALVRALPSRVPVTVMGVPLAPSETVAGSTDRITLVGAASLSVIVIVVASTVSPVVVPLTVSVSRPS